VFDVTKVDFFGLKNPTICTGKNTFCTGKPSMAFSKKIQFFSTK
jgi:hypothetical protein